MDEDAARLVLQPLEREVRVGLAKALPVQVSGSSSYSFRAFSPLPLTSCAPGPPADSHPSITSHSPLPPAEHLATS